MGFDTIEINLVLTQVEVVIEVEVELGNIKVIRDINNTFDIKEY